MTPERVRMCVLGFNIHSVKGFRASASCGDDKASARATLPSPGGMGSGAHARACSVEASFECMSAAAARSLLTIFPPLQRLLAGHPSYSLLGFSVALADEFLTSAQGRDFPLGLKLWV